MIFATPGYFETLRMRVEGGRTFEDRDNATAQPVALVNREFVRKYLPGQDAIGTHLDFGGGTPVVIVGIVANTPQNSGAGDFGPLATTPTVYVPSAQTGDKGLAMIYTWFSPNWIVRTRGPAGPLKAEMQAALQAIDPKLPFSAFKGMADLEDTALARERYQATLFSIFAGLALLLATVGIYGLVATSITQRTREIGIRLALGATLRDASVSIVAPGLRLATAGIAAGLLLTWFATKLLQSLVWGIPTHDPLTYASVAALMALVALLANLLPTLQFIRLDLARTLHQD
jgi:ABC-type antimicrobial peptide transport system permease subunit